MRFGSRNSERDVQIQRYWDALVTGASPDDLARLAAPLDPSLVALIAQVRASHQRRRPDPAFVNELERSVMDTFTRTQTVPIPISPGLRGTRGARPAPRTSRGRLIELPQSRRSWASAQLATALLLIVTLAAIYFAFIQNDQQATPPLSTPTVAPTATTAPTPAPTPIAGWTGFKGDAGRSGVADAGPTGQPVQLWRTQVSATCNGAPAAAAGLVYAACDDGMLYAFDAATGEERWRFTGTGSLGDITIAGGLLYQVDSDQIHALDAATGEEQWTVQVPGSSSPVVDGGLLVTGTAEGYLIGLDAATGAERWRYQVTTGGGVHSPAVAGGVAYVGSDTPGFVAVDTVTGELLWTGDTGTGNTGTPVVAAGIAYIGASGDGSAGQLFAFDAGTGALLWSRDEAIFTPAVFAGTGYSGSSAGIVYAFDTATGNERWRVQFGGTVRPLAVANGVVYVPGDVDQTVYALDVVTGNQLWAFPIDGGITGSIAVTGGVVYVATTLGNIYAIGGTDQGAVPAATPLPATPAASPVAAEATPVEFLWATNGGPTALVSSYLVVAAPDGTIWVIDNDSQYQIFDASSAYLETWTPTDANEIGAVGRLVFDPDGGFYVNVDQRILHYDRDRRLVKTLDGQGTGDGQFLAPVQPAVDDAGNLYVGDEGRHDIQVFDPAGNFVRVIGGPASPSAQFPGYFGTIAFDADGNLYVTVEDLPGVRKFTPDGTLLMTIGGAGSGDGEILLPGGLAVDADGTIFAADGGKQRVVVYDVAGQYLGEWGSFGADDGEFSGVGGIALDGQGNVYVSDWQLGRVQKFHVQPFQFRPPIASAS